MTIPVQPLPFVGSAFILDERRRLENIIEQMKIERESFRSHWTQLASYIKPRRGRFFVNDVNKGDRRNQNIIDSTPTFAARTLSSGMMSGITNPARPWFRLTVADSELADMADVKEWLHEVTLRMNIVMARSNLYNILPIYYTDLGVFGTAAMLVEEDDEDVVRCLSFPIGSYMMANDAKGRVRVFAREFQMTVRQIVEQFCTDEQGRIDLANASSTVRQLYEQNQLETRIDMTHMIGPNPEADPNKLASKYKPFASWYWETGTAKDGELLGFLQKRGYDEFPIMATRWEVTGEDVYATDCPGMTALGDIKQLQLAEKRIFQAVEKMVSPPMRAPAGLKNARLSFAPNDISFVPETQGEGIRAMQEIRPDVNHLEMKQQQARQRIEAAFFADLFLMIANDRRSQRATATEIEARHEEKLLALGPVLERLNQELLNPAIDRVFAIMARRDMLPPAPEAMQGLSLRVEYISIMAAAQRMVGIGGIDRLAAFVTNLAANTQNPQVLDKIDTDQMVDEYADMMGVSPRVVRPDEDVEAMRMARAEAAAQQQAVEQAKMEADAMAKLGSIKTDQPNAMTDLLGMRTAPGMV